MVLKGNGTGNSGAQNLETTYAEGMVQSDTEALRWWVQVADQGKATAQFNLEAMWPRARRHGDESRQNESVLVPRTI